MKMNAQTVHRYCPWQYYELEDFVDLVHEEIDEMFDPDQGGRLDDTGHLHYEYVRFLYAHKYRIYDMSGMGDTAIIERTHIDRAWEIIDTYAGSMMDIYKVTDYDWSMRT